MVKPLGSYIHPLTTVPCCLLSPTSHGWEWSQTASEKNQVASVTNYMQWIGLKCVIRDCICVRDICYLKFLNERRLFLSNWPWHGTFQYLFWPILLTNLSLHPTPTLLLRGFQLSLSSFEQGWGKPAFCHGVVTIIMAHSHGHYLSRRGLEAELWLGD